MRLRSLFSKGPSVHLNIDAKDIGDSAPNTAGYNYATATSTPSMSVPASEIDDAFLSKPPLLPSTVTSHQRLSSRPKRKDVDLEDDSESAPAEQSQDCASSMNDELGERESRSIASSELAARRWLLGESDDEGSDTCPSISNRQSKGSCATTIFSSGDGQDCLEGCLRDVSDHISGDDARRTSDTLSVTQVGDVDAGNRDEDILRCRCKDGREDEQEKQVASTSRSTGDEVSPSEGKCLLQSDFFRKATGMEEMGQILQNEDLRASFKQFLRPRFCEENVDFVEEVNRYQQAVLSDGGSAPHVLRMGGEIEETFLMKGSIKEVNVGQDMREACLANRRRDVQKGKASISTFNKIAYDLISMLAHTMLRDFKSSQLYATVDACIKLGPRDCRNSGATSSMTFEDDEDIMAMEDMAMRPRNSRVECMSEAQHRVADWYGLADDVPKRPGTWC